MAQTLTAGTVRACCVDASHMRVLTVTPSLVTRQCCAPCEDGTAEIDGVRVCGRKHYRATLVGLGARATGAGLGG